MQKLQACLWFDKRIEEAADFYLSVFPGSKLVAKSHYPESGPQPGAPMIIVIDVLGQELMLLNGGPDFKFTEAVSLVVYCDTQAEVDAYWQKLTADGGEPSVCGWLKDRYGLSWQITPRILMECVAGKDRAKAGRAFAAMLKMTKIDIAAIERAAAAG